MSRRFRRVISVLLAVLLIPAGWLTPIAAEMSESSDNYVVYHETFEDGNSVARQSGGASLDYVTDKVFDGNEDGAALYVNNRTNNYDGPDFFFEDLGLVDGRTYTVTIAVYVDSDVTIPKGALLAIQPVGNDNYGWVTGAEITAGKAMTLTGQFTADFSMYDRLRVQSDEAGKTVPFYIGDILITGEPEPNDEEPVEEQIIYHETFKDGVGKVKPAGDVTLEVVSDLYFDGNEDGKALKVDGRTQNWHGVDIAFSDVGMADGVTYTIRVIGYIAEDVEVPAGAKATLQNVQSYEGLYVEADIIAGQPFVLTGRYTVDQSRDFAVRIQSNEAGQIVPFYIGDILITGEAPVDEPSDRPPAIPFIPIDFEDNTTQGFEGRAGSESLTVTDETNHTEGGKYALKVEGRSDTWHGPSLRVEKYIDLGYEYKISVWVKMIEPSTAELTLSTQVGSDQYINLAKQIVTSGEWVQLEGRYRYTNAGGEYITIYIESNNATASFYIDDVEFVPTGAGPVDIERDLDPIKEVYKDDFLIGSAISAEDLDGVRFELLTMHHNLATAGNAMKPDALQRTKGQFTFDEADEMVNKVLGAGMKMHGHVLVWHQQSPDWMNIAGTDEEGKPIYLSREEALDNLRTHIRKVVEHFGDRVISWDVVNEAMSDNPPNPEDWEGSLRKSAWYHAIGPDYIEQAFLAAREVIDEHGWDIKLYYNDYNDDNQNKAEAIYQMVKEINERYAAEHNGRLLIDGIGMQGHYNLNTNPANVRRSLEKFISLGVEVGITELDIKAGENYELTDKEAKQQAYLYAQLFQLYKEYAEHISRVTFWGLDDGTSWLADRNPLLFDRNLKAKPAYYAVIDPEKYIEEYDPEEIEARQGQGVYGTPVIDGEIDAVWNNAPDLPIDRYQMAWQGANGTAKVLWDEENLYVLVRVNDSELDKSNPNEWEQDSIEVFLDQLNTKQTFYVDGVGQYRINYENETSFNPAGIDEGFESAVKVTGSSYTVEVKIPLTEIRPKHGTKIGFDVQINDARSGARQSVATWNDLSGQGYQDPSVFGVLTLIDPSAADEDSRRGSSPVILPPTGSVEVRNGVTAIRPAVRTIGGHATAEITNQLLRQALGQAAEQADGSKQIVVDLAEQVRSGAVDVQLPASSLQSEENYTLLVKLGTVWVEIPSRMLVNHESSHEQVKIRIAQDAKEQLAANVRDQIGDRPVIKLDLVAGDEVMPWSSADAPVIVTIPYTPSWVESLYPDHIVVWHIDDAGKITAIPNSRYDAEEGVVRLAAKHFSTFAVTYVYHDFTDTHDVPWARDAIEAMAARDIIRGIGGKLYAPYDNITRADFVALLVRALELQAPDEHVTMFRDVPASAYYYDELRTAKQLGIAAGTGDGAFQPAAPITRQDMMVLTVRALEAAGRSLPSGSPLTAYADADLVADYAKDSVTALAASGIIAGKSGNRIAPQDHLTRAEAAVILYRIWKE